MKIAVVMRQVPDLVEALEIASSGKELDLDAAAFIVNETDDHALEQALLLKERLGGEVLAAALDFGEVDNTLYTALAKGADRAVKLGWPEDCWPGPRAAAPVLAELLREAAPDVVLTGAYAHDELDGSLGPLLAHQLGLPYAGVLRGVTADADGGSLTVLKEFPGAVMAELRVRLPAVLGVLAAEQPPRYTPVSRIRGVMKSAQLERREAAPPSLEPRVEVRRLYPPPAAGRAEMLEGSEAEIAARIVALLKDRGLIK